MKTIQELYSKNSELCPRLLHIYVHICSFYKSSFQISIFKFLNFERRGKCPCIEFTQKCYWCICNINWTRQDTRKIFGKLVIILTSRKLIKDAALLIFSKVKPLRLLHLNEQLRFYGLGISSFPATAFGQFFSWQQRQKPSQKLQTKHIFFSGIITHIQYFKVRCKWV